MAVDLLAPRTDLTYLRRRVRPGSVQPKPSAPVERVSLRLRAPGAVEKPKYATPNLSADVTLSADNPVVRLNRRQSAIGNLSIVGATDFAWEVAGVTGGAVIGKPDAQATPVPEYAGRPLVQAYKGDVVLNLRHARNLRRLLVRSPQQLTVSLYAGRKVTVVAGAKGAQLLITRIGDVLELRREEAPSTFGFGALTASIAPLQIAVPPAARTPGRPTRAQAAELSDFWTHGGGGQRAYQRREYERSERERRLEARAAVLNRHGDHAKWQAELLEDLSSDISSRDIYRKYTS